MPGLDRGVPGLDRVVPGLDGAFRGACGPLKRPAPRPPNAVVARLDVYAWVRRVVPGFAVQCLDLAQ